MKQIKTYIHCPQTIRSLGFMITFKYEKKNAYEILLGLSDSMPNVRYMT
jgi:hypothetical protein